MSYLMQSPALAFFSGLIYVICTAFVFVIMHGRSKFSLILIYSELFILIGLGVGPIVMSTSLGAQEPLFHTYLLANGTLVDTTFYHIAAYAIGGAVGVVAYKNSAGLRKSFIGTWPCKNEITSQVRIFRSLLVAGLVCLLAYVVVVGPVAAITTAGRARAGFRDGLEEASAFFFLKNVAQIGTFAVIFVPLIFALKSKLYDIALFSFYGFSLYLLTGARAALLDTIYLAFLVYMARRSFSIGGVLKVFPFLIFGFFFVFYGKGFGDEFLGDYFGEEVAGGGREVTLNVFLMQFVNLVYSINSGVISFSENGPIISKAVLLAPLGLLPSWLFSSLGLEGLSWQFLPPMDNIVCRNTLTFPLADPCTMPPYYVGTAAYLFPVVFGFLFGFARYYFFSFVSSMWHRRQADPSSLWMPLFYYFLFTRLSMFIPNVIGLFSFFGLLALLVFWIRRFFSARWI